MITGKFLAPLSGLFSAAHKGGRQRIGQRGYLLAVVPTWGSGSEGGRRRRPGGRYA